MALNDVMGRRTHCKQYIERLELFNDVQHV